MLSYAGEVRRKLVHLSSLWMPMFLVLIGDWHITSSVFAALLALNLIAEHEYAGGRKGLGTLYGALFGRMLRKTPESGRWVVSGGPYVLAAALLAALLFSPSAGAGGLVVMLLGDTAAALYGRKFGRHAAPNGKSYEGVAAFVIVGGAGLLVFRWLLPCGEPIWSSWGFLVGLPLAAAAELFEKQLKMDDNFSIVLLMGAFLSLG